MAESLTEGEIRDLIHKQINKKTVDLTQKWSVDDGRMKDIESDIKLVQAGTIGEERVKTIEKDIKLRTPRWAFIIGVAVTLAFTMMMGGMSVWLYSQNADKIEKQEYTISEIKGDLNKNLSTISGNIIKISTDIIYMKESIDSLKSQINQ